MTVELRHLRALVAVVEEGTFTDAAIALGTTQASVSRAVASLEQAVGVRLLARTTRAVAPTEVGRRVLAHARQVLDEVRALERVVGDQQGDVRLGYAWAALGEHTVEVQRRWARTHPGRALVLVSSNTATAGLAEGIVEIAVLRRPLTDRRFVVEPVGTEDRFAVLASADPLSRRRSVVMQDFRGRTLAVDTRTGTTGEHLWPVDRGPAEQREVRGIDDFLTCVAAGQAIGMTSAATVQQHPRPGVAYRRVKDAPPVEVTLAWRRDDPPPGVLDVLGAVREAYAIRPDGGAGRGRGARPPRP